MSPFVRKVTTTSGATAVQIVDKTGGEYRVIEHLGSAHTPGEIAALMEVGRERLHPGQGMLDLDRVHGPSDTGSVDLGPSRQMAVLGPKRSSLLIDTIATVYQHLGFDQVGDQVFFDLVLARLVEPTSKRLPAGPCRDRRISTALQHAAQRREARPGPRLPGDDHPQVLRLRLRDG